jgi:hypothetical protein
LLWVLLPLLLLSLLLLLPLLHLFPVQGLLPSLLLYLLLWLLLLLLPPGGKELLLGLCRGLLVRSLARAALPVPLSALRMLSLRGLTPWGPLLR